MTLRIEPLRTGADVRIRNRGQELVALLVNGGTARAVPGTWSATSELLAEALAPSFPEIAFVEVRYRVKTWKQLSSCMADAEAALDLVADPAARRVLMIGFSMGGAVSIGVAGHPAVGAVLGLAPWIPDQLPLDGLIDKRLDVVHGSWDRYLPGIPGVSPATSRRGFERARALGVEGTYELISGGVHGAALRSRSGRLVRLPRWGAWVERVGDALARFAGAA